MYLKKSPKFYRYVFSKKDLKKKKKNENVVSHLFMDH